MQIAKDNITTIVKGYIELFPDEFNAFKSSHRITEQLQGNKFAEAKGTGIELRLTYEVPETLYSLLKSRLSVEEREWFKTAKGAAWFANTFPAFKVAQKV